MRIAVVVVVVVVVAAFEGIRGRRKVKWRRRLFIVFGRIGRAHYVCDRLLNRIVGFGLSPLCDRDDFVLMHA